MLDIHFIRDNPDTIKAGLQKKGVEFDVGYLLQLDEKRRAKIKEVDDLRAGQNIVSQGIVGLSPSKREEQIARMRELKAKLCDLELELKALETEFGDLMRRIPNLPLPDVPEGGEESNQVIREVGEKPKLDFPPKEYLQIAEALDLIDMERAAKVAGSRFGYLKREAALLEFALVHYAYDALLPEGFIPIVPPVMLRGEHFRNIGRMPPGQEQERYFIPSDDLYLAGSAEHTVAPLHADEVLDEGMLPLRYLAFSTCFRREAGSYGKDTKGILRVHQFDKVEMYSFVTPEDDTGEHEKLVGWQERLMQGLGLPYRVVLIAAGDLAWPEAKLIDIEAWLPGQGTYRETHSASTTTDFQTRGVNTRYRRKDGSVAFAHSLNATAIVIGRTIIAILENYQQEDGSVKIPKDLQPYMHGVTDIRRRN